MLKSHYELPSFSFEVLTEIAGIPVFYEHVSAIMFWTAGMMIDADGGPHAYNEDNTGLDHYGNAGYPDDPGSYTTILVCDGNTPVNQRSDDPAPGYWISRTAYERSDYADNDPRRYVNSEKIPFIVVPPSLRSAVDPVVMGCAGFMRNLETGKQVRGVVADIGPGSKLGEASIAAAAALGVNPDPRCGGTESHIIQYVIFPGRPAPGFELKPMY
jgi:hypothetical protein